eukprot:TRINITY_DN1293_c0_g1_i2.p1 TRINITY_DN1293_c0_g1~~TRINITY_DN1293_c0_g1_i2.p1  ORF type:complete len:331 (-),score=65.90 TRINITY_DN1293_c0_g1_i2:369-1361(-)
MKSTKSSKQSQRNKSQYDMNSKLTNDQQSSIGTTDRQQQLNIEELQEYNQANFNLLRVNYKFLSDQAQKLEQENQQLRNLNSEYAQKLNGLAHQKPVGIEKIVLTSEVFESQQISSKVKDYIRKLANNYKLQEREQTRLISQCELYNNDLKIQKEQQAIEQKKFEDLLKKHQTTTEELLLKIKMLEECKLSLENQLAEKIDENKQLQLKIENSETMYKQQIAEHQNLLKLYDNLQQKYTALYKDYTENAVEKKKKLNTLKHHCDELEYQLRNMQSKTNEIKNEKILQDIKVLELEQVNQQLSNTGGSVFANKYQSVTHKSNQSPTKIQFK